MKKIKFPVIEENEITLRKEFSYPEEFEYNTTRPLMLEVHDPYDFMMEDGKVHIIATWLKKWMKNPEGDVRTAGYERGRKINLYNPLERFDQDTFLKTVMSIDVDDPESVLFFYNEHGILGLDNVGVLFGSDDKDVSKRYGVNMSTAVEEYSFFKNEITNLQTMIKWHEAITTNDYEYFRNSAKIPATMTDNKVLHIGKTALMHRLNLALDLIQPIVRMTSEGEFYKGTHISSLLGVFYFRLFEIVTENQKLKKCRYCGNYFIPRKANANFCPPPEANERSKCTNRYDAMVRRIAEWHFKEGLTIDEIKEKLTKPRERTKQEIKSILDNYKGKLKSNKPQ